jgi:hypothetical protein
MLQDLQKFLQAKLVLANASLQKSKENSKTEKKHLTCSCNWHFLSICFFTHLITFLFCLPDPGTLLRAPLVSLSPSLSPVQFSVQPPLAACRKAKLQLPPFTFYDAPCLLVSWSELAPLRPEDWEIILLGPWGIDLIPCLLSLGLGLWTAWSAVDCSQRAAAPLSSLDQLSAAWCWGRSVTNRAIPSSF